MGELLCCWLVTEMSFYGPRPSHPVFIRVVSSTSTLYFRIPRLKSKYGGKLSLDFSWFCLIAFIRWCYSSALKWTMITFFRIFFNLSVIIILSFDSFHAAQLLRHCYINRLKNSQCLGRKKFVLKVIFLLLLLVFLLCRMRVGSAL